MRLPTSSVIVGLTLLAILSSCSPGNNSMNATSKSASLVATTQITSFSGEIQTIRKTVSYGTPSGTVNTAFSLGINTDGIITTLDATTSSRDHEDREYAERFTRGATQSIIGKKLSSLSLNAVGGASLTTEAFQKSVIGTL